MDLTHLPKGVMLNHVSFIPWKTRVDAALKALSLPTTGDVRADHVSEDEWLALSSLAAKTIHGFVPEDMLKKVSASAYYDHEELVAELEDLTLRFSFLKLPEELQNMVWSHVNYTHWYPLQDKAIGHATIGRLSKDIRERMQAVPQCYQDQIFVIVFEASTNISPAERTKAEQDVYVPTYGQRWARGIDDKYKDDLRRIMLSLRVQHEHSQRGVPVAFGFKYVEGRGLTAATYGRSADFTLTAASKNLLADFAAKIETERKALGVGGRSLIMALVRDDPIWKYGTLRCEIRKEN